jgi:hypothetical protein
LPTINKPRSRSPDGSFEGTADGNITVTVGNVTSLSSTHNGQPWIGNFANSGEAGDLTLVTGSLDGDHLGAMFAADLGSGDGSGGNVTVGLSAESDTLIGGHVEYSSSNTLSILSAGNVVFLGSLQNDGSGAINVVAGWDGTTLDSSQFTSSGVFGNNGGSIVIGYLWGPGSKMWKKDPERFTNRIEVSGLFSFEFDPGSKTS